MDTQTPRTKPVWTREQRPSATEPLRNVSSGSEVAAWLAPAFLVIVFLVIWETVSRLFQVPRWFLPAPTDIAQTLVSSSGLLAQHAWVTAQEIAVGFAIAFVAGVSLAIAIAYSRLLERALYPFVVASQTVPVIAIAPLLLIWFGYGILPKVIIVALICFFPIVVNMVDGLRSVEPELVNLMRTMGASRWQIFAKAQVPTSLPYLFSGTKVAIAISVIGAVIGEWVGASAGLGYFMVRSQAQLQTSKVFAAIVVLSAMGIFLFALASVLERQFIPWHRKTNEDGL